MWRVCARSQSPGLHLIEPFGFNWMIQLKRAGMDYWHTSNGTLGELEGV